MRPVLIHSHNSAMREDAAEGNLLFCPRRVGQKWKVYMSTFRFWSSLPFGKPGDSVQVEIRGSSVHFTHRGLAESARQNQEFAGQLHAWSFTLTTDHISSTKLEPGRHYGSFPTWLAHIIGLPTGTQQTDGERQLTIRASIGERLVNVVLSGQLTKLTRLVAELNAACQLSDQKYLRELDQLAVWRD